MDLDCMQLLMIACVFSIDIFNVSSTLSPLDHYTGLQSVSIPQFIHPCIQSSEQTAVQPAQALSQSRWVVRTNHRCSPMLWLASVPAALTPSYFFLFPHPVSRIPLITSPLFRCTNFLAKSRLFPLSFTFPPKCLQFSSFFLHA